MSLLLFIAYATQALGCALPLDMVPLGEIAIRAAQGPANGSNMPSFQPRTAPTRWFNSSLKMEMEYGLLRRALERGTTASYFVLIYSTSAPLPAYNATSVASFARFARARLKVALLSPPGDPYVHALLLDMWLVVVLCACAVILDFAMAVFGAMLHLSTAPPMIIIHAISCIMSTCMSIMTSPYIIQLMVSMILVSLIPMSEAAGNDQPKTSTLEYSLPGVSKWDGLPFHDFRRIWWVALCAALGSISQDSYSLLQTARDEDIGSPATGGTAAQRMQSGNRNQRLFGAILNYIEASSWVYRYASAHFNNDGRGLFNYLYVYGHLPYTPEQQTELENEWTDATMSKVGIKFNDVAVFKWAEYVTSLADKLNKSEREKRVKYLSGFPSSFDIVVVPERQLGAVGSYTHPPVYPAHDPRAAAAAATAAAAAAAAAAPAAAAPAAATPAAPLAGAHPLAGEPDIMAMARGFYPEWARMTKLGMIKSVPRGMAYQTHETERETHDTSPSNEDESRDAHAFLARERVTSQTVCLACGGIGHAAKIDGIGECLTARLGHRVPNSDLNRMTYPDGYTPPRRSNRPYPNSNSHTHTRHHSNPRRHSNHNSSRSHARVIEPDPYDSYDCDTAHEVDDSAMRLNADERARRYRPTSTSRRPTHESRRSPPRRAYPAPRRNTRFASPRTPRHVRQAHEDEVYPEETQQTSARHDAEDDDNDDEEHHGRLAVAFDAIEFP